jgi:hypothetical protein
MWSTKKTQAVRLYPGLHQFAEGVQQVGFVNDRQPRQVSFVRPVCLSEPLAEAQAREEPPFTGHVDDEIAENPDPCGALLHVCYLHPLCTEHNSLVAK